jgi:pimeloyl-ACP methyl ester carboxylesterase
MPYANNRGTRIYYQVEGCGPPLVLVQAAGQVLQLWRTSGYAEALKNDYRLVLMDLRGHGGSDKPCGSESYRLDMMVSDVLAVLDDLELDKAHFWGYSLGGVVGYLIPMYAPERFHSLIIGGAPDGTTPEFLQWVLGYFDKGVDNYVADFEKALEPAWTPQLRELYLQSDMEAFKEIQRALVERIDYKAILSSVSLPCFVYVGEQDAYCARVKEIATWIPEDALTFVSLPELDHWSAITRSDLVIPHVHKFLSEVGQAT